MSIFLSVVWICFLTYNKKFIYICFYIVILSLLLIKLQKTKKTEEYINNNIIGKRCIVNGIVTDIPKESTRISAMESIFAKEYIHFPILIKDVTCKYRKVELKLYALVYMEKETGKKMQISVSDSIRFKTFISKPIDEQDNWKFQFKKFLYANGYTYSMIISNSKQIINKQKNKEFDMRKLYSSIYEFLDKKVNGQKEYVNFLQALLFGATYKLSDKQKEIYINSGTYHFFAVSGFSVMVLYIFLLIPFKALLLNYRISGVLGILIIWLYITICGFVPSAQRAGIIITFFLLSNILYRKENHIHSLLLAFIFILIVDNPFAIFDVSFQYSFIIYATIVLILTNIVIYEQHTKANKVPSSAARKSVTTIKHSFMTFIIKLNKKCTEVINSLPIIGRSVDTIINIITTSIGKLINITIKYFASIILITLVASISISPLTIKYFGLGKVLFLDNIIANCISSIFFSIYFIISLIFLLLLFVFGNLPYIFWYIFKGVPIMEWILSKITSNNTYFGMPTGISVYVFYMLLIAISVLTYINRLSVFKTIVILVCMQFSFIFFCDYPKNYKMNSLYSITTGKNTIYYYVKTNNDVIAISTNPFNKQLFYNILSFLRYIRFLNGSITFITSSHTEFTKPITFRNFSIHFKNIEKYEDKNITIKKDKVTKKFINLFISTNNLSVLYLQSMNKKWLTNFLTKNKTSVIEIDSRTRKPSIQDILCNSANLIINRSTKFNITCDKTKTLQTSETIYINKFIKH